MGVAGITGDTAYPEKSPRQTPPMPLGSLGDTVASGLDKLGWLWWPSDSAGLTAAYDGRAACNNRGHLERQPLGVALQPCPILMSLIWTLLNDQCLLALGKPNAAQEVVQVVRCTRSLERPRRV